jgi:hypothetical protein
MGFKNQFKSDNLNSVYFEETRKRTGRYFIRSYVLAISLIVIL